VILRKGHDAETLRGVTGATDFYRLADASPSNGNSGNKQPQAGGCHEPAALLAPLPLPCMSVLATGRSEIAACGLEG
jgi:hypothetical protein